MLSKVTDSFTLPTQHFRMAVRMFAGAPEVIEALLSGSDVTPADLEDPQFALPISSLWTIWHNASRLFGDAWFLDLPILWSVEVQSEFGLAMRCAPNLAKAIDIVEEFWHVRWPIGRGTVVRTEEGYRLAFERTLEISDHIWQAGKCLAALNFSTTARAMIGDRASEISYDFDGPPLPFSNRLAEQLGAKITWNNATASVFVPASLLGLVSPFVNMDSFQALIDALRRRATLQRTPASIAARVTQILDGVTRGQLDADATARRLGISTRTLERQLAREGLSFRQLARASLLRRLEKLIVLPNTTADTLADALGYHDGSSLMRACRRFFGKPLSQIREELQDS
jgi:AraC-like DNA-binding protein